MTFTVPSDSRSVLDRLDRDVPEQVLRHLPGVGVAAPARSAASVILVRDAEPGLEAYLLHRHGRMPFAPGMVVFPGGGVDPVDVDPIACAVREAREETGVDLDPAALMPWAHWITPEFEPRRYDTVFFVARLPDGATTDDVSGETDQAGWQSPAGALADLAAGRIQMLPPTLSILVELSELGSWARLAASARDRQVSPVLPRAVREGTGWVFDYGGWVGQA